MPFVKKQKNKAYFKRFQVQFRRRREGKTDYRARKRLIAQDKNKYNAPKYRLVVRVTNKDIIAQIIYARIVGDFVVTSAYAHELNRYGMPVSHTSYAGAYSTGLLIARRLLKKFSLDTKYAGNANVGEDYNVEELEDGPAPFRAILDVGLRRTTSGAIIFAAMKGAADGGIDIPHSQDRFVGYDKESKSVKGDVLRKYIFGGHISDYMKQLKEDDSEKYGKLFSAYVKAGIKPEELEAKWTAVHKAIRADPAPKAIAKKEVKPKRFGKKGLTLVQRKGRVKQKMDMMAKKKLAAEQSADQE